MRKLASAFTLFLLISFFAAAQETKPAPKTAYSPVPVKAAREPNPVKSTPESLAEGKKIYRYDGELFYIVKNGHDDMPPEGGRARPGKLWDLVNYVRSLARKQPPADQK